MVSVRVVSKIRRVPVLSTLPSAIRLLNILAIPCPFQPKTAVVNPRLVGVTLGLVFGQADSDINAASACGETRPRGQRVAMASVATLLGIEDITIVKAVWYPANKYDTHSQ